MDLITEHFPCNPSLLTPHETTVTKKHTLNNVDQMITTARRSPEKLLNCPSESSVILSETFSNLLDFKRKLPFGKWVSMKKWEKIPGSYCWGGKIMLVTQLLTLSKVKNTRALLLGKSTRGRHFLSLSLLQLFFLVKLGQNHHSCVTYSLGSLFPLNCMWDRL